jgi:lipopolysaccharide export system protein LptC
MREGPTRNPSGAAATRHPGLSPARDAAFRRARRHSRLVRALKVVLPVSALVVAGGFVAVSYLSGPGELSVEVTSTAFSDGKLVMANPKLEGLNRDNLPYTMTAGRAVQESAGSGLFQLEDIDAKLPIDAANWVTVDAASAIYDRDNNTIEFTSDTLLTTTDGMVANLKSAFIDMSKGDMFTKKPVDIKLRNGTQIAAQSLRILENGKVLVFEDRVQMAIEPQKTDPQTTGGGDDG